MQTEATRIGRVRQVLGSTVTVELDPEMAGVAPIYRGELQYVGQIGSLVRLPQGLVDLIGSVRLVGIAELAGTVEPTDVIHRGERWLQVELLGEVQRRGQRFERGVANYPALDDPVHFVTPRELTAIYPFAGPSHVRLGCLSSSDQVPVCLDAAKLVVRHCAIVGSSGSGKTSAVATLLQNFASSGWGAANIVVVDPHGEYAKAFASFASVRSVLSDGQEQLRIPYWALEAGQILHIFAGGAGGGATVKSRFAELVTDQRRAFAKTADWLEVDSESVTSDTPIPFDLRKVWHQLAFENSETRDDKADASTVKVLDRGSADQLRPPTFVPYGQGGSKPHQGPNYGAYQTVPQRLRTGLSDPRLSFLIGPQPDEVKFDSLGVRVSEWIGGTKPVSVLDFSGVPQDAADVAVGVVLNLLFELAIRGVPEGSGLGRPNPLLVVLEEAHRYLGEGASEFTRSAANRIAREGRKYGVGLMLVTQRPTELPATALAQCGTIIALRLTNSEDQGTVRSALPDAVADLALVLPSLRTGEAIVSGEAVILPSRVVVDLPQPLPQASDPTLDRWRQEGNEADTSGQLNEWRRTFA